MRFSYQARTKTGKIQTGIVDASSRESALNILRSHDLYPTILEELNVPFYARELSFLHPIKSKDIVLFSRELAILFQANVPIVEAFKSIARQTRNKRFKEVIMKIAENVEGGTSLSESLSSFPKLFSSFYINMVKSGEESGKISEVFNYLADYLEKEHYFRSKIRGALVYPAFVFIVFIGVVSLIVTYVIPQMKEVLESVGTDLPAITKFVLAVSDFVRTKFLWLILGIAAVITGLVYFFKSEKGKVFASKYSLQIPFLGTFLKKYYLSRFALNLSTLISAGLPIVKSLEITSTIIGNRAYKELLLNTRDGVKKGESINSILENYPNLVSPLFYQIVAVGEKTGNLSSALKNVVIFYQREVDQGLEAFTQLIEPVFIILLGGVVGGLMAAVMIPLYSFSGF